LKKKLDLKAAARAKLIGYKNLLIKIFVGATEFMPLNNYSSV
jgi:hypothetical protein